MMSRIILIIFVVFLTFIVSPNQTLAETPLDVYMNDFYTKSNEASKIIKEIETDLKKGLRRNVCSRQREAARLGLLANKSLIKAFEIGGTEPPMEAIKSTQERWESILRKC
tara:strand:- start:140 stop:472 length:333 start_codon:yes stop_codon:yes gene_type:complete